MPTLKVRGQTVIDDHERDAASGDDQAVPGDQADLVVSPVIIYTDGHSLNGDHYPLAVPEGGGGQRTSDAQNIGAASDLDRLHASLGHYARLLWDIQKVRVAMGNRVGAMERDGLGPEWTAPAREIATDLDKLESAINNNLRRLAKRHFMADWIDAQRGIGLPGFARILGIAGPFDDFATVSKLWKYLGQHVENGERPRRRKGEKLSYSPQGQVVCHQIGESIVKAGSGHWREVYDAKKAYYEAERPDWPQARRHNAAMRYAVKMLIKAMWIEWRRRTKAGLEPDARLSSGAATGDGHSSSDAQSCRAVSLDNEGIA